VPVFDSGVRSCFNLRLVHEGALALRSRKEARMRMQITTASTLEPRVATFDAAACGVGVLGA